MNKPLTIARQEFTQEIVDAINRTEIPMFVIADILKSALAEVNSMAQAQYEADVKAWQKAQEENDENQEN